MNFIPRFLKSAGREEGIDHNFVRQMVEMDSPVYVEIQTNIFGTRITITYRPVQLTPNPKYKG